MSDGPALFACKMCNTVKYSAKDIRPDECHACGSGGFKGPLPLDIQP
jgi:hypothetical protein